MSHQPSVEPSDCKLIEALGRFGDKSELRFWLVVGLIYSPAIAVYGLGLWLAWSAFR